MRTKNFNEYSYQELYRAATAPGAQQIDIDTLGAWFERYGMLDYWNGVCFNVDGRLCLYPIYGEGWEDHLDDGDIDIIGYDLR